MWNVECGMWNVECGMGNGRWVMGRAQVEKLGGGELARWENREIGK